jgi:parallel beta-helix repeat protein
MSGTYEQERPMFFSYTTWLKQTFRRNGPRRGQIRACPWKSSAIDNRFRPMVELLEDRQLPSTFTVVNTSDSGAGSLRQAILDSNSNPSTSGPNIIVFELAFPKSKVPLTISPVTPLPAITAPVVIDAMTQPGWLGTPVITLSGSKMVFPADGLVLAAGGSAVLGLAIDGFTGPGIVVNGGSGNVIALDYIGVDLTGAKASGNAAGLVIQDSSNNLVTADVISGNHGTGVTINGVGAVDNELVGDLIGTSATGSKAVGNSGQGVLVENGAASTTIVGSTISGNQGDGISFVGATTTNNTVLANRIGTDISGKKALANAGSGVSVIGATATTLGGTGGQANTIANNMLDGVDIEGGTGNSIVGNKITQNQVDGVHVDGGMNNSVLGNTISQNSQNGLSILNGSANQIGAAARGQGNTIQSNGGDGVLISGATATQNVVQGNTISQDGQYGVGVTAGASNNMLGGSLNGQGNTVTLNGGDGLYISGSAAQTAVANSVVGNFVGTNSAGARNLGNKGEGIEIAGYTTTTLLQANVVSGNSGDGIKISGPETSTVTVQGNLVGTDPKGTAALGNGGNGIDILGGVATVTVGGPPAANANVISGNKKDGVHIAGPNTTFVTVAGNLIGTNRAGTSALGNQGNGVSLSNGASECTIGSGNVISGNSLDGVDITGAGTSKNVVTGNLIGTDRTGAKALPNQKDGVAIEQGAFANNVGGLLAGQGNTIAGNRGNGVSITAAATNLVAGNQIGTPATKNLKGLVNGKNGVYINGGTANIIGAIFNGNTIAGNGQDGVQIVGGGLDVVFGNQIVRNYKYGVDIKNSANNVIGMAGPPQQGNTISENFADGVVIQGGLSFGNSVQGNTIAKNFGNGVAILSGASDNTVGGLQLTAENVIVLNTGNGVGIKGSPSMLPGGSGQPATGNNIFGNFIGTTPSGQSGLGNLQNGIEIGDLVQNTTIRANIIASNGNVRNPDKGDGIRISGASTSGVTVQANLIGTDPSGNKALPNLGSGISVSGGASSVQIVGNVISGNKKDGVKISDPATQGVVLQGNLIGTSKAGNAALANEQNGVEISGGVVNNTVGAGNIISGNVGNGIKITGAGTSGNTVANSYIGIGADGNTAIPNGGGVLIEGGATQNTVTGSTISGNVGNGVEITGPGTAENTVTNSYIGIGADGNTAIPNGGGTLIEGGATQNTVSDSVISGNLGAGIRLAGQATNTNTIQGNMIGTDAAGTQAVANEDGVFIDQSSSNVLSKNVISGNTGYGILITGADASANQIAGNFIGTDQSQSFTLGNGIDGVRIEGGASQNVVGKGNVIQNNVGSGVSVSVGVGNLITQNSIFNNGDGITLTDNGNMNIAAPSLAIDSKNNITLSYTGKPNTTYTIEFFASPTGSQGKTYLGSMTVTTDGTGQVKNAPVGFKPANMELTSTATDPSNDTSPFSNAVFVKQMGPPPGFVLDCGVDVPTVLTAVVSGTGSVDGTYTLNYSSGISWVANVNGLIFQFTAGICENWRFVIDSEAPILIMSGSGDFNAGVWTLTNGSGVTVVIS